MEHLHTAALLMRPDGDQDSDHFAHNLQLVRTAKTGTDLHSVIRFFVGSTNTLPQHYNSLMGYVSPD